jgi:type I restriction enzyme S subunit
MNKYQSYKSSSVDWIGEIPSSWDSGKMKYVLSNNDGGVWGTDIEDEEVGTLVVRSTEITIEGNWDLSQILKRKLTESEVFKCKLYEGDIVITKSSGSPQHIGKSVLVSKEIEDLNCCYSNFVQRIRFKHYNSKLYHYILNSEIVREQFKYLTTSSTGLGNLNGTSLNDVLIPFIPLNEQHQIVQFLDEKTNLIDKLISTKESKVSLLKEQRTSLINQVVTKGLNPIVKMKDSGVEWIGEIPEHWVTLGFTKIIKIRHGYQFREYDFTDEGIRIVKITQLDKDGYLNLDNCSFIDDKRIDEFERILIKENDVLMCLTGGTIGKIIKVGKVNEPLVQNYRVGHFSPLNDKIKNDYVFWFMTSSLTTSQMFSEIRETGQPNIGMEDFGKMKVILPPLSEQIEIVKHLVLKTKEIDDLVDLEKKKIDLLKEYRQSLISEVVTGKIKVTTDE